MSRIIATGLAGVLSLAIATGADAQSKVIPGEHRTATATVEAIEGSTRLIAVRTDKGELRTFYVPESVTRFNEIKVGSKVAATYYDNIIVRVKATGEPDVDTRESAVTPREGVAPGGTSAIQQTITATVDAIDLNVPSITLKGPRGFAYSTRVQDKAALERLKTGDRVDITWTSAVLVAVAPTN